jgi:hypothetical protein
VLGSRISLSQDPSTIRDRRHEWSGEGDGPDGACSHLSVSHLLDGAAVLFTHPAIHSVHILVFTRGASPPVCTPPDAPHRMGTHRMCASTPPCLSSQDPSIGIHPGSIQRVRCTSTRPSHERVPSPSHQHRSSAPFISTVHQHRSSAPFISACHQHRSSAPFISTVHQRLSSALVISACHQRLSSALAISACHQRLSSALVISACHQRLSSARAISACHQRWSSVPPRMRIRLGEDLLTCR